MNSLAAPTCNGHEIIGEQVLKWCRIGEVFVCVRHYLSGSLGIFTSDVCVRSPELILMQLRHHLKNCFGDELRGIKLHAIGAHPGLIAT